MNARTGHKHRVVRAIRQFLANTTGMDPEEIEAFIKQDERGEYIDLTAPELRRTVYNLQPGEPGEGSEQ